MPRDTDASDLPTRCWTEDTGRRTSSVSASMRSRYACVGVARRGFCGSVASTARACAAVRAGTR
ncbi:hypothetical protein C5B94_15105 [Clavibacter michiganensis]|nr:hypothetical protein C5B94_15105 [Clavibacter michiganensis]